MGSELQDTFKKGNTSHALKYFKEEVLSALIDDLTHPAIAQNGLVPHTICDIIQASLARAISGVDAKDAGIWGGIFRKHFKDRLKVLLSMYVEWNNAKTPVERMKLINQLREIRRTIFDPFYNYMDELAKTDNQKKQLEYRKLLKNDKEINKSLGQAFAELVLTYPNEFRLLKNSLATYNKRTR